MVSTFGSPRRRGEDALKSGEALRGLTFYHIHIIGDATRRVGGGKMNLPL